MQDQMQVTQTFGDKSEELEKRKGLEMGISSKLYKSVFLTLLGPGGGERALCFLPHKIILFRREKKVRQKYQIFIILRSQTLFWRVLGIQTSLILLNIWQIIPHQVISKKNSNPSPTQARSLDMLK